MQTGGTSVETRGTTSGAPILIDTAALRLEGPGASTFAVASGTSSLAGDIAASQTVELGGAVAAASSLTNRGTLVGHCVGARVDLPPGDTLTNDGTIAISPGCELSVQGDLVDAPSGMIDDDGANYPTALVLSDPHTSFDNEGTLNVLFPAQIELAAAGQTFDNSGTLDFGLDTGADNWGSFGLHSNISTTSTNRGAKGDTVVLGGTIHPVMADGLPPLPAQASKITFEVVSAGDVDPNGITISCPAATTRGWSLTCTTNGEQAATLTVSSTATLDPTSTSLTSSSPGPVAGGPNLPTIAYGTTVTFTATVSTVRPGAPAPSGRVVFYEEGGAAPAVLGTARPGAGRQGRSGDPVGRRPHPGSRRPDEPGPRRGVVPGGRGEPVELLDGHLPVRRSGRHGCLPTAASAPQRGSRLGCCRQERAR